MLVLCGVCVCVFLMTAMMIMMLKLATIMIIIIIIVIIIYNVHYDGLFVYTIIKFTSLELPFQKETHEWPHIFILNTVVYPMYYSVHICEHVQ